MDIRQYLSLRNRQRAGNLDEDDHQALQQWSSSAEGSAWLHDLQQIEHLSDGYKSIYEPDVEAGLLRLKTRIAQSKAAEMVPGTQLRVVSRRRWWSVAAAAVVLTFGVVALRVWMQPAVKTVAVQTHTEEQKSLTLTDGTQVQLNDQTTLILPETFKNAKRRKVTLQGEAYFEVKPNPEKPFEISADELTIVVLGTAFNVRAYPEEMTTEVEVTHGRVRISIENQELILTANEKGIYDRKTGELYQKGAPQLNAQAWLTHRLKFETTPLSEILQELERYHKVKFEVNSKIANCKFTGDFRKTKLEKVMETLELALNVQFTTLSAKKYRVKGGTCQ